MYTGSFVILICTIQGISILFSKFRKRASEQDCRGSVQQKFFFCALYTFVSLYAFLFINVTCTKWTSKITFYFVRVFSHLKSDGCTSTFWRTVWRRFLIKWTTDRKFYYCPEGRQRKSYCRGGAAAGWPCLTAMSRVLWMTRSLAVRPNLFSASSHSAVDMRQSFWRNEKHQVNMCSKVQKISLESVRSSS